MLRSCCCVKRCYVAVAVLCYIAVAVLFCYVAVAVLLCYVAVAVLLCRVSMGHGGKPWVSDFNHPHFLAGRKAVKNGNVLHYVNLHNYSWLGLQQTPPHFQIVTITAEMSKDLENLIYFIILILCVVPENDLLDMAPYKYYT